MLCPVRIVLSIAMQLSNFWRDIGDDYHRIDRMCTFRRIDLDHFGSHRSQILRDGQITHRLIELLEFEIERTERYYEHARESIAMLATGRLGRHEWLGDLSRHPDKHPPQPL